MSAKSIALAALVLLFTSRARATVIEIPLPELLGYYQNTTRVVSITLPGPPALIHSASFRIAGTTTAGEMYCSEDSPPGPFEASIAMEAVLVADDFASEWGANDPYMPGSGAFAWTRPFQPVPPSATWWFLMDGVTDLTFYGIDPGTWCRIVSSPSAVITEAVFIIDAEFPIAVEPTTWGKIKALYR